MNDCESNPNCVFLREETRGGITYLIYFCKDIDAEEAYPSEAPLAPSPGEGSPEGGG